MSTPVTITRYSLRAGSPMPKASGSGCNNTVPPQKYILQTFGVDVFSVDTWDSIVGLYGSEVLQGQQNFEDTDTFREHSYSRISYTGTGTRDTDGNLIYKGTEEHSSEWAEEDSSDGILVWTR